jgi:diketogulonate reductase-like aldo/keto reductase
MRRHTARGPQSPGRRQALRSALGIGAAAALARLAAAAESREAASIERAVPKSGERLPAVGLGTWQSFDVAGDAGPRAAAREVLRRFASGGGRVIDSSPMYGSAEAAVGELAAELGVGAQLFHATKVWTRGREAGIAQMEESFRRMRVARMDLMQVHNLVDAATHLPTLRAWQAQGRIRYLGLTHYHAGAHDELERLMQREKPDFIQINYSLAEPEAERRLLPLAVEMGVAVLANRPYAEGALFRRVGGRPLPDFAAAIGAASWGQLFLKWILGHPAVTCAIPATRNPEHVLDNLGAAHGPLPDAALRRRMTAYLEKV